MEKGGVTYPEGFLSAGVGCGIKKGNKKDLSLIYCTVPAIAAGCFTTNQFKSYSLLLTHENIRNPIRAILINSGNANACNGEASRKHTELTVEKLGEVLKISPSSILFASTGIIGKPLPFKNIMDSLNEIVKRLSDKHHEEAAEGILTTDRSIKEEVVNTGITGRKKEVVIGGMAKGAGMINPNMATMLSFLTTDAVISQEALTGALKEAVDDSFNMLNIDGDQSTNDMVICLASGFARNPKIHPETSDYKTFAQSLKEICIHLAKKIASDGEGAEKFVEVKISGAWCKKDARKAAKRIIGSNLVKSAIAGSQPNWGRVISSLGSTNARIDIRNVEICICGVTVFKGNPLRFSEHKLKKLMAGKEIRIEINLNKGSVSATAWGCDLTEKYVKINREY